MIGDIRKTILQLLVTTVLIVGAIITGVFYYKFMYAIATMRSHG